MSTGIAAATPARLFLRDCMTRKVGRMRASRAHREQIRAVLTLDTPLLAEIGGDCSIAAFPARPRCSGNWSGRRLMRKSVQAE
jgi:hypothetical protein